MFSGKAMNCSVDVEERERMKNGNRLVADEGGNGHSPKDETDVAGVDDDPAYGESGSLSERIEDVMVSSRSMLSFESLVSMLDAPSVVESAYRRMPCGRDVGEAGGSD